MDDLKPQSGGTIIMFELRCDVAPWGEYSLFWPTGRPIYISQTHKKYEMENYV